MSEAVRRVVVGVDGTPGSLTALRRAAQEARRHDAELHPVVVYRRPESDGQAEVWPFDEELDTELCADAYRDLRHDCMVTVGNDTLTMTPAVVESSNPGLALPRLASREGDMLVVGTTKHNFLHRFFFGSTRKQCAANATCPVLVVPPDAEPRQREEWKRHSTRRTHPLTRHDSEAADRIQAPA